MASNTGCTSDGELAITFRISAVAVRCSSASCVSLNSRTFSIAMAAWSAKVRSSAMCLSSKGCTSVRRTRIEPSARPSRSSGTASVVWWPCLRASSLPRG